MSLSSDIRVVGRERTGPSRPAESPPGTLAAALLKSPTHPLSPAAAWTENDQYRLIQPQINAEGVHVWPFNSVMPIDLRLLTSDGRHTVQKNRHDYFEIFVLCSGATTFLVEDRLLPMNRGDLGVIGSTLYHSIVSPLHAKTTLGVLYFDPNLIGSDGSAWSTEYLAPFLRQDSAFPHVLPAATGVPGQVLELMRMMHSELPGTSMRGRLAIRTYLKMILMLLVNQYSSYADTLEALKQQQRALDRLNRFFEFLSGHVGDPIDVRGAARMCGLSESDFVSLLKQATGRSFRSHLNHCRVERAQAALADTNQPISDIAQEIGFCDQSYFGAVFHKLAGITPLDYRRRHRSVANPTPPTLTGSVMPRQHRTRHKE